ncbi:glycosyl hydrolase family 18 protein [Nocardioides sp. C4-1]|uniref:glycosyl hydrolase family 18 protein n=1 Tax=Nocardioides sp. C4-1 TaxID=3151851 RepID=UPI0032635D3A
MLRTAVVALVAALLVAPTLPADAAPGPVVPAREPEVTGFALGSLPASVVRREAHALRTVAVSGVGLAADGRGVGRPTADVRSVARAARRAGLRTELVLSNYSNRLGDFDAVRAHRLLSSPAAIDRVARRMSLLVARGPWGGVNVDLELVRRGDAAGLVALCAALQRAMPAARTVSIDVSAAGTPRAYRDRGYALTRLGRTVDRVVVMAYDQHGPTWSGPGPVGALPWQRRAMAAALTRVPAERLDLGVAGYGYTWPKAGSGRTGRSLSPRAARRLAREAGVRPTWHQRTGEWSVRLPDGTRIWWSDARSYALRVRLAEQLGVRGVAVWRLGSADPLPR